MTQPDVAIDPIDAEIISCALNAVPNHIDTNITRTAYSPLIYEYKDYAVGLVDHEGRLISQCRGGIPIFTANSLGVAVRDGIAVHGRQNIHQGDVFISNHSGTLGQHLNNVIMYTPIFSGTELFGFFAVNVHWMDIGGIVVGSCLSNTTTDIFQEGIQFRSVKLWSAGEPVGDMYRMIECNTRMPRMVFGDLEAQLGGCLLGRDMVAEIIQRYGLDTVRAAVLRMWQSSERAAREAIAALPDGVYRATAQLDNDAIDLDKPVPIDITVHISGDEMEVDFTDIAPQLKGPMNSGINGGAITAARVAFRYLVLPDEQGNEGTYRPLRVKIPAGTFLSASDDAPKGAYSAALPTVIDTVVSAMAQAAPERAAAAHHGTFAVHVFHGRQPDGSIFHTLETGHGGWGATRERDGQGPFKTMVHGDTLDVPIEVLEAMYPLRVGFLRLRQDSGGPGMNRGGLGIEKEYDVLAPCGFTVTIERTTCHAWGVRGGKSGEAGHAIVMRANRAPEKVLKAEMLLDPGDKVLLRTGGGGGYGEPRERHRDKIERDVRLGYISEAAAKRSYGA
jgi:N-methylhydantoinase B